MSLEWREKSEGVWWLVFEDAPAALGLPDAIGTLWPPMMTVDHAPGDDACWHLYSYSNGAMPGEVDRSDDVDYLHICDLDEHIVELLALRAATRGAK